MLYIFIRLSIPNLCMHLHLIGWKIIRYSYLNKAPSTGPMNLTIHKYLYHDYIASSKIQTKESGYLEDCKRIWYLEPIFPHRDRSEWDFESEEEVKEDFYHYFIKISSNQIIKLHETISIVNELFEIECAYCFFLVSWQKKGFLIYVSFFLN